MTNQDTLKPLVIEGSTVGQLQPQDDGYVVVGLKDQFFTSESDAARAIAERRARTVELVERQKSQRQNVRITIGNTLHQAILDAGLWVGLPVESSKTQTVVEVENTDMLRASLQELIANLEGAAKANTRTERSSMRSRALIGAARVQLAKL